MRIDDEITISIIEYEKMKTEIEKLRHDNEVYAEVLDYISKGAEQVINDWGKDCK